MMKLRSAAAVAEPTYHGEEEPLEPVYRTLTGSGLTPRPLFWGAALILFWFTMDVASFLLDHIVPGFKIAEDAAPSRLSGPWPCVRAHSLLRGASSWWQARDRVVL